MSAEVLNAARKYTKFLYSVEIRVKSVELLPQFGQKGEFRDIMKPVKGNISKNTKTTKKVAIAAGNGKKEMSYVRTKKRSMNM